MKKEYDFSDSVRNPYAQRPKTKLKGGVRGKHLESYSAGTNLVLLAPDVREAFPTDSAVNKALRLALKSRTKPKHRKNVLPKASR